MRGQHHYKLKALLGVFFLVGMQLFAPTPLAVADTTTSSNLQTTAPCQTFQYLQTGYLFDNYETHDYNNGFLALHFRLKQPYNDGRQWTDYGFYVFNQACKGQFYDAALPRMAIPAGVQLYSVRFSSPTHYDFWDDETDTHIQCAECSVDISSTLTVDNQPVTSVSFYARIDGYGSWVESDSFSITPPSPAKTPVLIIPGILGSELSYIDNKLWPNLVLSAISDDGFMDPLQMDSNGHELSTITVGGVVGSVNYALGKFDYTDGLVSTLTAQGYTQGTNLFLFPYDWRTDPVDILAALKTELDTIAALNPNSPKIDIVAHSYGGLVLKRYIQQTSDARIGKIIFVGVPQLGSAEAAQALLFGSDLGIPILSSKEVFKLAQNMPMIYDLLPGAEYYKHAAGFFDDLSNLSSPQIPGFDSDQATLTALGKNIRLLNQAALSHTDALDNMDFSSLPYTVSSIVGCGLFTEKTINKMYEGDPTIIQRAIQGPKYRIAGDSGDGTVIMQSAAHDGGTVYYAPGIAHSQLLSNPTSAAAISNLLQGTIPDPTTIHTADSVGNSCDVQGKLLSFSSNVNVVLKNRTTGATLVPQQDYNVIQTGNDRHIFIPSNVLPIYSVQVQDEVAGGSPENISITNTSTTKTDNHNTYNYNKQKLDANLLAITFPNASASESDDSPDVENVDPTTGDVTTVAPSNQLDGSYTTVPGSDASDTDTSTTVDSPSTTITPTTTAIPTITTTPSQSDTSTEPTSTDGDSDETETIQPTVDDSNSATDPAIQIQDEPDTTTTATDAPVTQTKTIHAADGESITINITNAQPSIEQSPVVTKTKTGDVDTQTPEWVRVFSNIRKIFLGIFF